jgi:hypothetical protein
MVNFSRVKSLFTAPRRINKKYLAFFTVVPLLVVLSIIQVPCPICGGTGSVSTTGMGQVEVVRVESTVQSVGLVQGCLNYIVYTYNVTLILKNDGKLVDASGYVRLGLVDYKTSKLLATQYTLVAVPAGLEIQTTFATTFTVGLDAPTTTQVTAEILLNNAPCDACKGTGRVALNNAPFLSTMKKTYAVEQQVSVVPVVPPAMMAEIPEDWIGQEGMTDQWYLEHPVETADQP